MNRESKVKIANVYLVEMWEDGVLKEERYLPGKSKHYAEDCAENWENGIIPSPGIDSEYQLMANDFIRGQN